MENNELLVNAIVISRVVADAMNGDYSYQNAVKIADELKLTPYQVNQFLQLYKRVQQFMII